MDINEIKKESLRLHGEWKGKMAMVSKVPVTNREELSLAYTPGVAEPCKEINKNVNLSYTYTGRGNTIAVITDGTAVLGLGDIGPEAGMPVMEGKCVLFKTFGGLDAIPLCLKTKDPDEIVRTVYLLSGSFGGINLEDISAPRCFEIEKRLKEICDIPIFHDDQHGTAVVVGAAMLNALRVVGKNIGKIKVVINGAGAAGLSIANYLLDMGVNNMLVCDKFGILSPDDENLSPVHMAMAKRTNTACVKGNLALAMNSADVFIGVSAPNVVSEDMVRSMNKDAIVFPLANPVSEISREAALNAGAAVVGTGSSANPNQINNVLVFPGIFRGALDVLASDINKEMMLAASYAIADCVTPDKLSKDYIIPYAFDETVHNAVAKAVAKAAIKSGVARKND